MNIIIPLGGRGERFSKNGYTQPKPLIPIFEKCMIEYVLDNLKINKKENDMIFIIYNTGLTEFKFTEYISKKYPCIRFIPIRDTKGAVETLFLGIDFIFKNPPNPSYHNKCLILDCDTFYTEDVVSIFKQSEENMVFYTKTEEVDPIYSYIQLDNESNIIDIKEKNKISNNANTGAYAFTDIKILYDYCKYVLDNNITFNNEPYTSCVISEMVKSNIGFKGYELQTQCVFSLGTPVAVENYIKNTYAFLFDLDGTMVITDDIYFQVWYDILLPYNVVLTKEIFTHFIQGNNDQYVLNRLLTNIEISLTEISHLKDTLFIQNIHKLKIVDGIYDTIQQIKMAGHKICIVTNCNRGVANEIVKHIRLTRFIDFIISSNDCIQGKPNSEPYRKAIEKYNISNNKCFIFEDSKSGILSAKMVNPKLLVGIETIYNNAELMNYGVHLSIKDFQSFNIQTLIHMENNVHYFTNILKKNSNIPHNNIKQIHIDEDKLKGGFIADVIGFKIIMHDNQVHSQILKYENNRENNLSAMAKKLELYNREYYFYTHISPYVNIKIPVFHNLIFDKDYNKCGIVLENLLDKKYQINLNLNVESIDVTLKIVDRMAQMHSKFWNVHLKKMFPEIKGSRDATFYPFLPDFINKRYALFQTNWFHHLNKTQQMLCDQIYKDFDTIQESFSGGEHLTFIHGDIKSPNLFYDIENDYEPYFIDWQHCAIGKGVQDLIFFIIESFDITHITHIFEIVRYYYYKKIQEYGILNYPFKEYEEDLYSAIGYVPFFTSVWFGTTPQDELIDKNFPYFFINKMAYLLEYAQPKSK